MLQGCCLPLPATQHRCCYCCRASLRPTATCCASTAASGSAPATRTTPRPWRWLAASGARGGRGGTARAACPRRRPACRWRTGAASQASLLRPRPAVQLPVPPQTEPLRRPGFVLCVLGQPRPGEAGEGYCLRVRPVSCWPERLASGCVTGCLVRSSDPIAQSLRRPSLVPPVPETLARLALAAAAGCAKRWLRPWTRSERRSLRRGTPEGAARARSGPRLGRVNPPRTELRAGLDAWHLPRPARLLSPVTAPARMLLPSAADVVE